MAGRTRKLSIQKIATKLKEVRTGDDNYEDIQTEPICLCEPIGAGCKCGRIEWERMMRDKIGKEPEPRHWIIFPQANEVGVISKPPDTDINYCGVPFRVWAKCEGKKAEIILVQQDEHQLDWYWCFCDVSHITKNPQDQHWFPNDSLLEAE